MRILNEVLLASGNMSGNITSPAVSTAHMGYLTVAAIYVGTVPTGTLKLQCSLDSGVNWIDIPSMSVAISASGSSLFEMKEFGYPQVRAVYTFTSGTGSLLLQVNGKGF